MGQGNRNRGCGARAGSSVPCTFCIGLRFCSLGDKSSETLKKLNYNLIRMYINKICFDRY